MIEFDLHKKLNGAKGDLHLRAQGKLEKGEIITLYGPSGSGKTSTIRMIAGLMNPDSGYVKCYNEAWYDSENRINRKIQFRNTAIVFQDYALFPHLPVRNNIQFAAKNDKLVTELITAMHLEELADQKPQFLSGGQQQRVALARALAQQSQLLLMDEPFSALDEQLSIDIQKYTKSYCQEHHISCIMISHDIGQIVRVSDSVISIDNGCFTDKATPKELFDKSQDINTLELKGIIVSYDKKDEQYIQYVKLDGLDYLVKIPSIEKPIIGNIIRIHNTINSLELK